MYWIIQRHDAFDVVQADKRPERKQEKGKRQMAVHGPFQNQADAKKRADEMYENTAKGRAEKARMS